MLLALLATLRLIGILTSSILLLMCLAIASFHPQLRAALTSVCFRWLLFVCGIQLKCKIPMSELRARIRTVIVANHVSYLDVIVVGALRPCLFLAKEEVRSWPVFGWVAQALGCVFVRRETLMGRANALRRCLSHARLNDIALFPEGTTTAAPLPDLKVWAKGHAWIAQRAEVDSILCLGLIYENQAERAWTDDMSLLPHLFKTLGQLKTCITVTGAWVPVHQSLKPAQLAFTTHEQLCLAVHYECS